ncbi:hypothetical protein NDI45_25010 [Leptolyngbya sp. GB1-A1]|uniref:hypothetical protein n=1 Tax=Leptolyngbya sp. GB1-A1 TaxID=2933908 RepID=UPI003297D4F6
MNETALDRQGNTAQRLYPPPQIAPLPQEAHIVQVIQIPSPPSASAKPLAPPRSLLPVLLAIAMISGTCAGVIGVLHWQNHRMQALEAQNALLQGKLDRFQQCLEVLR